MILCGNLGWTIATALYANDASSALFDQIKYVIESGKSRSCGALSKNSLSWSEDRGWIVGCFQLLETAPAGSKVDLPLRHGLVIANVLLHSKLGCVGEIKNSFVLS